MKHKHVALTLIVTILTVAATVKVLQKTYTNSDHTVTELTPKNVLTFTGDTIVRQGRWYEEKFATVIQHSTEQVQQTFQSLMEHVHRIGNYYQNMKLPYPLNTDLHGLLGSYFDAGMKMFPSNQDRFLEWLQSVQAKLDSMTSGQVDWDNNAGRR